MEDAPEVKPLPYSHRNYFFYTLATIFLVALPFLFLYATGYRFTFNDGTLVGTGGIYVAAERTGAEIYIDGELVRETRVFRRAFYAQSLDPGTHRVHVQKDGHHTWVKELPVYRHLVTEAQAFNLPLVPEVRVISPWKDLANVTQLKATSTLVASTSNSFKIATNTKALTLAKANDEEYKNLIKLFVEATTTVEAIKPTSFLFTPIPIATTSTSTEVVVATTTKENRGVRLYQAGEDIFAEFVGLRESMPYYYCAEEFEALGTSSAPLLSPANKLQAANIAESEVTELIHPIQQVTEESECDQIIRIDRQWQKVTAFDFYPGSTDFVVMALENGVYVVEVDDRSWQNSQPLIKGNNLDMKVENGQIYVYDGELIYQVILET
jgi:hypothetical protein